MYGTDTVQSIAQQAAALITNLTHFSKKRAGTTWKHKYSSTKTALVITALSLYILIVFIKINILLS